MLNLKMSFLAGKVCWIEKSFPPKKQNDNEKNMGEDSYGATKIYDFEVKVISKFSVLARIHS